MVSTHLKNISQMGNLPQIGVKIKNVSNHHLDEHRSFTGILHYLVSHPSIIHAHFVHDLSNTPLTTNSTQQQVSRSGLFHSEGEVFLFFLAFEADLVLEILNPKDPCREYLPTFPLECGHFSPNVGKYSIHGSYGKYSFFAVFPEDIPKHIPTIIAQQKKPTNQP